MDELALGSRDRQAASRVRMSLDLAASVVAAGPAVAAPSDLSRVGLPPTAYLPHHCAVLADTAPRRARTGSRTRRPAPHPPRAPPLRGAAAAARAVACPARRHASSTRTRWSAARTDLRAGGAGSDRGLPRRAQPGPRPRDRHPRRHLALDRQLGRGPAGARRREGGAHRPRLRARGLRRPVRDPDLHSRRRHEVRVETVKSFDEPLGRAGAPADRGAAPRRLHPHGRRAAACASPARGAPRAPPPAAAALGRQAQRPRPLRGPLRARGHPQGGPGGAAKGQAVFAVTVDRRAEGYVPTSSAAAATPASPISAACRRPCRRSTASSWAERGDGPQS